MRMKRLERVIEKRIKCHHDIAKIRAICMHKNIPLECIYAILPAKAKYLPGLEEDLENTSCIITVDGRKIFFEEGEVLPVSPTEHFETVGEAIKKILPEGSGITLMHNDKEYFACIPAKTWYREIKKGDDLG
jgi:hypothetical protein